MLIIQLARDALDQMVRMKLMHLLLVSHCTFFRYLGGPAGKGVFVQSLHVGSSNPLPKVHGLQLHGNGK